MNLILRLPALSDEQQIYSAIAAVKISEPHFTFAHYWEEGMPFQDWIYSITQKSKGLDIPQGHVQSTFLVALVDGEIVGRLSLRHTLNDDLLRVGGHIGYVTLLQFRRKAYATEMLRQSLPIAKAHGLHKVLLTCDQGNLGSQKTIENCGGILENIVPVAEGKTHKMRFWIPL